MGRSDSTPLGSCSSRSRSLFASALIASSSTQTAASSCSATARLSASPSSASGLRAVGAGEWLRVGDDWRGGMVGAGGCRCVTHGARQPASKAGGGGPGPTTCAPTAHPLMQSQQTGRRPQLAPPLSLTVSQHLCHRLHFHPPLRCRVEPRCRHCRCRLCTEHAAPTAALTAAAACPCEPLNLTRRRRGG